MLRQKARSAQKIQAVYRGMLGRRLFCLHVLARSRPVLFRFPVHDVIEGQGAFFFQKNLAPYPILVPLSGDDQPNASGHWQAHPIAFHSSSVKRLSPEVSSQLPMMTGQPPLVTSRPPAVDNCLVFEHCALASPILLHHKEMSCPAAYCIACHGWDVKSGIRCWRRSIKGNTRVQHSTYAPPPPRLLVGLHSRKGKGRAANGDRPVGAASCRREQQVQGDMPNPPHPTHDVDSPHTGAVWAWNAPIVRKRSHANDPASHVALPDMKFWCSVSASACHDFVAVHCRGHGM